MLAFSSTAETVVEFCDYLSFAVSFFIFVEEEKARDSNCHFQLTLGFAT